MSAVKFQLLSSDQKVHLDNFTGFALVIVENDEKRAMVVHGDSPKDLDREFATELLRHKFVIKTAKLIIHERLNPFKGMIEGLTKSAPQVRSLKSQEAAEVFIHSNGRIQLRVFSVSTQAEALEEKCKVLIVDDSATVRKILRNIIVQNPKFEVVGEVEDPMQVVEKVKTLKPHVLTLDINMPGMNGVEVLRTLKKHQTIPAVIVSSLLPEEGRFVIDALSLGAVDYIHKPSLERLTEFGQELCEKLWVANRQRSRNRREALVQPVMRPMKLSGTKNFSNKIIAIGASTGGTEAIQTVLEVLPKEMPPIVIVQHIPPYFSKAFADRLNEVCQLEVKEAVHGDELRPGRVLIAPGGFQMRLIRGGAGQFLVSVKEGELVTGHKPSVDALFHSIADLKLKDVLGVILTGMGGDGAQGLLKLRELGNFTIGQDEASCIVYGMPKVAMRVGAVTEQIALEKIADRIISHLSESARVSAKGA